MKLGASLARHRRRRPSDDRPPETGPRRRRSRLDLRTVVGGVIGLALGGWLIGYLFATQVFFPAPPPPGDLTEVPDLRGIGLASAAERLAGVGLSIGVVDSLTHPSVAAGLILGQSPLPGQVSRPQEPIRVTMSIGPQMRAVPDVRRLTLDRATIVLEASGFVVDVDTAEAEEPRGRVLEVTPRPDMLVALPASVQLLVSAGPPLVTMPFLLGLQRSEALQLLDSLGLTVSEVEEVFRFGRDQGIVVEQEPPADSELQRGGAVRIAVGRGGREQEQ